jgi:hypothetical protein
MNNLPKDVVGIKATIKVSILLNYKCGGAHIKGRGQHIA